jgi:hypothetical protein
MSPYLIVISSSNKIMPTIIDKLPDLTEVMQFIETYKLVQCEDEYCTLDLPIEITHYNITDVNMFFELKSDTINQHLKYIRFTKISIITMEKYPLYAIMDNFVVM